MYILEGVGGKKHCLLPCSARKSNPGSSNLNSDTLTTEVPPPSKLAKQMRLTIKNHLKKQQHLEKRLSTR